MSQDQLTAIDVALRSMARRSHPRSPSSAPASSSSLPGRSSRMSPSRHVVLGGVPALRLEPPGATGAALLYLHGGGYVIGSARRAPGWRPRSPAARARSPTRSTTGSRPSTRSPPLSRTASPRTGRCSTAATSAEQVVVAGDSAGGGLALALLVSARDDGFPQPAAVAVMSPWVDLTLSGESLHAKEADDAIFDAADIAEYASRYLGDHDPADPRASPLLADLGGLPPVLVQVGTNEVLLDDATRLAARAAAAHLDVTLEVVARAPHVFQHFAGQLDEADRALDRAGAFLSRHLLIRNRP